MLNLCEKRRETRDTRGQTAFLPVTFTRSLIYSLITFTYVVVAFAFLLLFVRAVIHLLCIIPLHVFERCRCSGVTWKRWWLGMKQSPRPSGFRRQGARLAFDCSDLAAISSSETVLFGD